MSIKLNAFYAGRYRGMRACMHLKQFAITCPLRNFTVNGAIVYCPFKDQNGNESPPSKSTQVTQRLYFS